MFGCGVQLPNRNFLPLPLKLPESNSFSISSALRFRCILPVEFEDEMLFITKEEEEELEEATAIIPSRSWCSNGGGGSTKSQGKADLKMSQFSKLS